MGRSSGLTFSALIMVLVMASWNAATAQNVFPSTGKVGIGTTSPAGALHVVGSGRTDLLFDAPLANNLLLNFLADGAVRFSLYRQADTGDLVIDSNNKGNILHLTSGGFVGIGTATPRAALHVGGSGQTSLMVDAPSANAALLNFLASGQTQFSIYRPAGTPDLAIDSNAMPNVVYLTNSGRVGVGTKTPAAMLHVAGGVQVDGNIAAKYQDVAEWVKTSARLSEGTVVVIDSEERDQVLASTTAYDTRVAGVVSDNPGVLLGTAGEGKAKVAHTGRVKVKVDTSYGPIAVGDLLVTSATPGYAMRSTPVDIGGVRIHRPGTLIGKALESFDGGKGEILVLLMLQ